MSIRVIVDITEGIEAEIARVKEIIPNDPYFVNEFLQNGIEVIFLGDYEKEVAIDNGYTVSVGTNLDVITGRVPRELAEKLHKKKLDISASAETPR